MRLPSILILCAAAAAAGCSAPMPAQGGPAIVEDSVTLLVAGLSCPN
jgi:hypothetical protein